MDLADAVNIGMLTMGGPDDAIVMVLIARYCKKRGIPIDDALLLIEDASAIVKEINDGDSDL